MLVVACEAITHASDFSTASSQIDNCADGTIGCNGICLPEDGKNCGACGTTCEASQVCSAGVCGSQCTGGTTQCPGPDSQLLCVDTQNDPANCGRCGGFPDAGACPICQNGSCTNDCAAPSKLCKGKCVEFDNDPKNCGGCGTPFQCADGQFCSAGKCGLSCGTLTECSGACVDPSSDVDHCDPTGGCGLQCTIVAGTFHGAPVCVSGLCGIACESGFTSCTTVNGRECVCGNCPVVDTGGNGVTLCPKGDTCQNGQCVGLGH
jgi:Stigma-specific protein, Stig1